MNGPAKGRSELSLRIVSGVALAALAVATAVVGGWAFLALWTAAALVAAFEWQRVVHGAQALPAQLLTAAAALAAAAGAVLQWWPPIVLAFAAALPPAAFLLGRGRARDTGIGVLYASSLAAAAILCRGTETAGLIVVLWLFAVVWGTDTCAYFTGRALGGPKLWAAVSPNKTWSGAIGGLVGGSLLGLGVLALAAVPLKAPHVLLALAFSVATQAGDLFESALKRRYKVKDAGALIPGHGGVIDRLDGFIFAAALAAAFGVLRGGLGGVPQALVAW
jgi:phosphatidate cytidylyltransferase